eukprot:10486624-Alexandrium_andersonii.AAC.1
MLALERSLADDAAELQPQLVQDRLSVARQAVLAARSVDEGLIRTQADAARRESLLERGEHIQWADSAAAKGVAVDDRLKVPPVAFRIG